MKLFRNFLSLAGAELVCKVLTFAAYARLARILGPDGFGYIEWVGAVLLCTALIVDQGFSQYGAREIAKSPERAESLISEIVSARFILAIISYVIIVVIAFLTQQGKIVQNLLLLYGISLFSLPLILTWVFQGNDKMQTVAIIQLIRQAVFALIVLAFIQNSSQIWYVAIAEIFAVSLAAGYSLWMTKRVFSLPIKVNFKISEQLFRDGIPIGLSQMFWVVKMFGATLIVGLVATAEDTGYFAGALRIFIALHTFVWLYYFNLMPSMSRAWQQGSDKFSELIKNSFRVVVPLSLVGGIGWILVSPLVMTIVYGQDFSRGSGALQWMAGACVAAAISGHYRFGLIAAGYQNKEMITAAIGALTALIFIPIGYLKGGVSGAAAALCLAEVLVLLSSWVFSRRVLFNPLTDSFPTKAVI